MTPIRLPRPAHTPTSATSRVITLFGGGGFIGRAVANKLAAQGHWLRIAGRDPRRATAVMPVGVVGQVGAVVCDITDPDSVARALAGADLAVNLVGILHGDFDRVHAQAPGIIARAAAQAGIRQLVQVSAIGAADDAPSAYGRSKAAGEQALRAAYPQAVILRPSIVFGQDDSFFNRFARMTRYSPVLPIVGPDTRFQPVFVEDVAEAVVRALMDDRHGGRTFELGGPGIYTFRQLMELMLKEIRRETRILALPFGLAEMQGRLFQALPNPPITYDQVQSLKVDNVVAEGALTLADLDIAATPVEFVLPTYLWMYRRGGRFAPPSAGGNEPGSGATTAH